MDEKPDITAIFSMLSNNNDLKNKKPEEILAKLINSNIESNTLSPSKQNSSESNNSNNFNTSNETIKKDFQAESSLNNMPDMETIMKLMKILKTSSENNPSKDLLNSLKPFLNDSRKEKVDQYVRILGITKALEMFNDLGDKTK